MKLCINADDLGMCPSVDRGILQAVEAGVVTSVSAMAVAPHLEASLGLLAAHRASVGAHLVAAVGAGAGGNVQTAVRAQLGLGRARLRQGFEAQTAAIEAAWGRPLSHVDTHQHIHGLPAVRAEVDRVRAQRGIEGDRVPRTAGGSLKQRALSLAFVGRPSPVGFFGVDLMGDIHADAVDRALDAMQAAGFSRGIWMVHPGVVGPDHPDWDTYREPRQAELSSLLKLADWLRDRVDLVDMHTLLAGDPA